MKNRDILITGLQSWEIGIGSNCKNLAIEFSKNNRVIYVNPPTDRITKIKGDKPLNTNSESIQLEQKSENLWVLTPQKTIESINKIPSTFLFNILNKRNNKIFASEIKQAIEILKFSDFIHFCDSDIFRSFYLKELLNPSLFIYYSRDNLLAVDYWKRHGKRLEPKLMAKADFVATNSLYLEELAKKHNPKSHFVGQGCDIDAYSNIEKLTIPNDLKAIPRPVIGYIGALKSIRLDINILEQIASKLPYYSLVLIGSEDKKFKDSDLHHLKNVYFLGSKPMEELPAYLKSFDVAINPQLLNEVTVGNYPRKIDEYLASGKPVVATKTIAMELFKDYVFLAENTDEWFKNIKLAIANNSEQLEKDRKEFASIHSWENNATEIYKKIEHYEIGK